MQVLEEIHGLCEDSNLVGISLMTNQFLQAAHLTQFLKQCSRDLHIVWGGIEPTAEPVRCLGFADSVCLGEGEHALTELADRLGEHQSVLGIRNLWFKGSGGGLIRNPLRPLVANLDATALPDYSCREHYVVLNHKIETLTAETLLQFKGERFQAIDGRINYPIMTSRGCPFSCTYCGNSRYQHLYPHERRLRWRSVENVIEELRQIQDQLAPIARVLFVDDNFTARSSKELEGFCEEYQRQIAIPFYAQVSPLTIDEKKLEILLNAGCIKIIMGVETASERVAGLYNRSAFHKALPRAIALISNCRPRMALPPSFQFIVDNPYETLEETLETLRFALSLPRPWDNPIYSLVLFPGTPLYARAKKDGLIYDDDGQIYCRDWLDQSNLFLHVWTRLYRMNVPPPLLKALLTRWVARGLSSRWIGRFCNIGPRRTS